MKQLIILFASVIFSTILTSAAPPLNTPQIFKHDGCRGKSAPIIYNISNLHDYGWGDNVSSCSVPEGWKLVFYEHTAYRGATFTVTGSDIVYKFRDYGWNDAVSSVKVYYRGVRQ